MTRVAASFGLSLLPTPLLLLGVMLPLSVFVSPDYGPAFLAFGIAAGLLAGTAEEIGWTGGHRRLRAEPAFDILRRRPAMHHAPAGFRG